MIWLWVLIAVIVIAAIATWMLFQRRRTDSLRSQSGPEYERMVARAETRREGEHDLASRRDRRAQLDIHPLPAAIRRRYADAWQQVQGRFVDAPDRAFGEADRLVVAVMRERGYPMDDFEQRAADVSVDHPQVVENYRAAHAISQANVSGGTTTGELRRGMVHYRALFEQLLGDDTSDEAAG